MKHFFVICIMMLFFACSSSEKTETKKKSDLTKIKVGMDTTQVFKLIGQPTKRAPMPLGIKWWQYGDNQMLVVQKDTIVNVVFDVEKMGIAMDSTFKKLDSLFKDF